MSMNDEVKFKVPEDLNLIQIEREYEIESEIFHAIKWGNPYQVEEVLSYRREVPAEAAVTEIR